MNKVNIGIIGAGWIVKNMHIPSLLKLQNVDIVAIYDTDQKRAKDLANEFHIENVCEKVEMFYSLDIDAAIVATPNFTHVDYSIKMLQHGIHVLCEKPVALYADEVRNIIELEKKYNTLYVPGFVNRWRADIQEIYDIVNSKKIGEIKSIDAGWLRKYGVPRPGTWFTKKELSGGGVLVDLGSHVIDICLMLLKDRVANYYELTTSSLQNDSMENVGSASWFKANYTTEYNMDVEDTAYAKVNYSDGVTLSVKLSWLAQIGGDCTYFDILCTKGRIKLKTLFGLSNDRLWTEDSMEISYNNSVITKKLNRTDNNTALAFEKMLQYFVNAISERPLFTSSRDALKTVDLIENLYSVEKIDRDSIKNVLLEELKDE